eukprot:767436-Hanusia_phi.AAC.15
MGLPDEARDAYLQGTSRCPNSVPLWIVAVHFERDSNQVSEENGRREAVVWSLLNLRTSSSRKQGRCWRRQGSRIPRFNLLFPCTPHKSGRTSTFGSRLFGWRPRSRTTGSWQQLALLRPFR